MTRTIKIDNALLKKFSDQTKKKRKSRELIVRFLIVCEGKMTEPNYFNSFPKEMNNVKLDIKCVGEGKNTLNVVEDAIKLKQSVSQKYDRVWAVFDKDDFPTKDFHKAIEKARTKNICCAWSNEAFELWYLLHFQYRNTPMKRTEYQEVIEEEINKKWNDKRKPFKYAKNAIDMYDILQKYGNQTQAIEWAQQLTQSYNDKKYATHNPRTQVYELVKQLIGQDEELNQEIIKDFL